MLCAGERYIIWRKLLTVWRELLMMFFYAGNTTGSRTHKTTHTRRKMPQVILLTGASSGIGYDTAKDLAAAVRRPKVGRQRDSISLPPRL